jgi:hypothetical protein
MPHLLPKVLDHDLGLLSDIVGVEAHEARQGSGGLPLIYLRVVLDSLHKPVVGLVGKWKEEAEKNRDTFRVVAQEYEALESGEAVLRLPVGSRWLSASALLDVNSSDEELDSDNAFLLALHSALLKHKASQRHFGPLLPQVFLNAATLDLVRAFCVDCESWVKLEGGLSPQGGP